MEERGKIICKKSDNKAFKLGENWYNLNDNVVSCLEKLNKGDEVVVTFEKKGVSRYVSKLVSAGAAEAPKSESTSSTEFACEVCGKALKDGKYKKCFVCNKSGATKPEVTGEEPKKSYTKTSYDNPEKTAQIQRGNSLNAAATVAGGCAFSDPDTAKQFTLELAGAFLEWLRAE